MGSQQSNLTECRECAGQVSEHAPSCPHCGAVQPALATLPRDKDGHISRSVVERLQSGEPAGSVTELASCRECKGQISPTAAMCPHCGAPYPARERYSAGKDWRSSRTIKGRPLVHVAWGRDPLTGKPRVAKGVIAIGQFAKGDIAIGQFAAGKYCALGQFAASFGIGIGQFAIAPLCLAMFGVGLLTVAFIGVGMKVLGGLGIDLHGIVGAGQTAAGHLAPNAPTTIKFPAGR